MLQLSHFSKAKTERKKTTRLLMLPSVQKNAIGAYVNDLLIRQSVPELWKAVQSFLDMAKDGVLESFHQVTLLCSNRALTEEVGYAMMDVSFCAILSSGMCHNSYFCDVQLALSFCLLDDSRSLGIILTTICRHTVRALCPTCPLPCLKKFSVDLFADICLAWWRTWLVEPQIRRSRFAEAGS